MPLYDFHCDPCDETVERRLPMAEAASTPPCPMCGQEMRRVYEILPVIPRPIGYSLKPGDPKYWDHFDDPLPHRTEAQKGDNSTRKKKDVFDKRTV